MKAVFTLNSKIACWVIFIAIVICWLLSKLTFIKKLFQEQYRSVTLFGSRSGPTSCGPLSGSKLFAKVISKRQKSPLASKDVKANNNRSIKMKNYLACKELIRYIFMAIFIPLLILPFNIKGKISLGNLTFLTWCNVINTENEVQ